LSNFDNPYLPIIEFVNLFTNAVQITCNSRTHMTCRNFWNYQSAHSIIDYPKMPRFSTKANLVKDLEAVVKSRTIKAYLRFYQGRRGLLLYQHHLVTGTTLQKLFCSNINSEFYGLANAYGRSGWKAGYSTLAFGKLRWNIQEWETFGFAKHFDELTRFSCDLLNDGPFWICQEFESKVLFRW